MEKWHGLHEALYCFIQGIEHLKISQGVSWKQAPTDSKGQLCSA